jgi:hypothetical protein
MITATVIFEGGSEWVAEFNGQLLGLDVSQVVRVEVPQAPCVQQQVDWLGLSMRVLAEAKRAAGDKVLHAMIEVEVNGGRDHCAVSAPVTSRTVAEAARRDGWIVACEAIGGSLALLHRLDHVWYDADLRETLMQVRAALSVAQSKIKKRIEL